MDALCIVNKHSEILYFTRFQHSVEKSIFDRFLEILTSSAEITPPCVVLGKEVFVYVFQDELFWCCCLQKDSFLYKCGPLFIAENLSSFHKICAAMIGAITQHSVTANLVVIQEIVIETMFGGYMQSQAIDKIQSQILSKVTSPKESILQNLSPGLFGIEKSAPTTASQQSLLSIEKKKKELFVDVVEKVWATVGQGGNLLRADVSGSVILHCFLQHSPILVLNLNSDLSTIPKEGFYPNVQISEIEFTEGVDTSLLTAKKELKTVARPGETLVLRYSLPSSLSHVIPFTLDATHKQLTHSDVELKLKLTSTTSMGTVSPRISVRIVAPPSTSTVMSRTNGPKEQSVIFTTTEKLITWTIKDFPGASYAQAFIRLVDAGENAVSESAVMDFEVSNWVPSGLRVENVRLEPKNLKADKWVRYLTTSDTVTFKFS